jgi:hypothetical protein
MEVVHNECLGSTAGRFDLWHYPPWDGTIFEKRFQKMQMSFICQHELSLMPYYPFLDKYKAFWRLPLKPPCLVLDAILPQALPHK